MIELIKSKVKLVFDTNNIQFDCDNNVLVTDFLFEARCGNGLRMNWKELPILYQELLEWWNALVCLKLDFVLFEDILQKVELLCNEYDQLAPKRAA